MTKQEAFDSMVKGLRVKHISFDRGEFAYMESGYIYREESDGDSDLLEGFWSECNGEEWENNWSIYRGSKK